MFLLKAMFLSRRPKGNRVDIQLAAEVNEANKTVFRSLSLPQMDPVQKAVLRHTFSASASSKRKAVSCGVCQLRFNSQVSGRGRFLHRDSEIQAAVERYK